MDTPLPIGTDLASTTDQTVTDTDVGAGGGGTGPGGTDRSRRHVSGSIGGPPQSNRDE